MERDTIFEYGKYLTHLISCTLNNTEPKAPFEGMDWEQLYRLACFHKAEALVFPTISKLQVPEDIFSKFTYSNHRMKAREARQEIEAQKIFSILQKEGIPFIKMKGIVLKNYYPMPYMRSQADVDICMSMESRHRCESIMKTQGYEVFAQIDNVDEYVKDNFFYYEMHSSVVPSTSAFYNLFAEPFSKVIVNNENSDLVLNNNYFYLHLILHLYKHFIVEGCGVRLFCDLHLFEKAHSDIDKEFIRKTLAKFGIDTFYNRITELTKCFFEGKPFSKESADIATFVFRCGDHGSDTVRTLTASNQNIKQAYTFFGKLRFVLQILFPPAKLLKNRYHILEKAPYLLPFYWVVRGFQTIFFKKNAISEQAGIIKDIHSDKIAEAKNVRALLGLTKDIH